MTIRAFQDFLSTPAASHLQAIQGIDLETLRAAGFYPWSQWP